MWINQDLFNSFCIPDYDDWWQCVSRINEGSILIPLCDLASPNPFSIENAGRSLERLVQSDLYLPTPGCYVSQEKNKEKVWFSYAVEIMLL